MVRGTKVQGTGFKVQGRRYKIQGTGYSKNINFTIMIALLYSPLFALQIRENKEAQSLLRKKRYAQ